MVEDTKQDYMKLRLAAKSKNTRQSVDDPDTRNYDILLQTISKRYVDGNFFDNYGGRASSRTNMGR